MIPRADATRTFPALWALFLLPAVFLGCSKVSSSIEELEGWTLPEGEKVEDIRIKKSCLKPVRQLASLGEDAVDPTLEAMAKAGPADSCGYIVALAYLRSPKALPALVERVKEEGPAGEYAAFALAKLKKQGGLERLEKEVPDISALPPGARINVYRAFAWGRNSDHYKTVLRGLEDEDETVRRAVADLVVDLKHDSMVAPLVELLSKGPGEMVEAAGRGLRKNLEHLKDRDVLPLMTSGSEAVRVEVLGLLAELDTPGALKAASAALDDPALPVRVAGAVALGKMKKAVPGPDLKKRIARMLDAEDADLSRKIHDTLMAMNARDAREVLVELLDSPRPHVPRLASSLLIQCAPHKHVSPKTDLSECEEIPKLIELLASGDKDTVLNAGNTLRVYTAQIFDDTQVQKWRDWWENHKALMVYIGKAQKLVNQVKEWKQQQALVEHKKEALEALERAAVLYEEVVEKNLCSMGFDREHLEINRLLRVVRTSGGMDD